jgi:hypothetical protein
MFERGIWTVTNDNRFSYGFLVAAIQLWLRVLERCTSRLAYPWYLGYGRLIWCGKLVRKTRKLLLYCAFEDPMKSS